MTQPVDTTKFHTTAEWEESNPGYTFESIYYYGRTRLVRKVVGRVAVRKRRPNGMGEYHFRETTKKIRWDGYGRCYSGADNRRCRDYDIHFK